MKYALRRNTTPRESVILRLHFDVGSLADPDAALGVAHFLEHMAFNGSKSVPEGEMVKVLERHGLAFGPDTNASTGFEDTTYMLDLPRGDAETVDLGLKLMRETAGNLTLSAGAVARERGVIQSEQKARIGFQRSNLLDQIGFVYPSMTMAERDPLGTDASIGGLTPPPVRAFYNAYYRPERATLVVVGDFDVDAMEAKVRSRFANWRGRGKAGADPDIGTIDFARPASADTFVDPAMTDLVTVTFLKPFAPQRDSQALRAQRTVEAIGRAIVQRRLAALALKPDAPFAGAGVNYDDEYDRVSTLTLAAVTREGETLGALTALENELRRAVTHGFTEAEVAEQVANRTTALKNAVENAETRRSQGLADTLLGAADGTQVVSTPADALARFTALQPALNAASVSAAFRAAMQGYGAPLIRAAGKAEPEGGTARLLSAYDAATRVAVAPPAAATQAAFAYTDFGVPGKVVSDSRLADGDVRRVRFANNVMLNLKRTDFQKDRVTMSVRIDGGDLLTTAADPTRVALASILPLGGMKAHSADELRTILAGRNAQPAFASDTDAFVQTATTTPADFLLQAQVLAAQITASGYRPEGIALLRRILPQQYAAMEGTPDGVLSRDVEGVLANDDPRFVNPPLAAMMALDWSGLQAALADPLAKGAIEIGVVGDFDEAAVIDAIARTYGALPTRNATFAAQEAARRIAYPADRSTRTLVHKGPANQATVRTYWPATDDTDQAEAVRIDMLGRVLELELTAELRERLGTTYSPGVGIDLSSDYPGRGFIFTNVTVDPATIAQTEAAIDAVAKRLATAPVSADTLNRARTPALAQVDKALRENGTWIGRVSVAQSRPERVARIGRSAALFRAVTAEDIRATAARYLIAGKAIRFRAISDKAAPAKPEATGAEGKQ